MRTFAELEAMMFDTLTKYERHLKGDARDWKFKIDNINSLGICYFDQKLIILNRWMVENSPIDQVLDTLLHECAHAFAGKEYSKTGRRMVHGKSWKQWARRLGASPKATVPLSELGKGADEGLGKKSRPFKYHIVYRDRNGEVEVVASCKRRLVRMHERQMKGRPETLGRLWMVEVEHYEAYHKNPNKLLTKIFK